MAKGGKLTKLKSVLKKMQSFKLGKGNSNSIVAANNSSDEETYDKDRQAVYVGKSRRRYLIGSDVIEHPLFRELVERSSSSHGESGGEYLTVGCEVVMFEHMLWMLENADPQPESLDELVEFYAY